MIKYIKNAFIINWFWQSGQWYAGIRPLLLATNGLLLSLYELCWLSSNICLAALAIALYFSFKIRECDPGSSAFMIDGYDKNLIQPL